MGATMPEEFSDMINRILRDHQGYTGDGHGGVGDLPVGDRSTALKPINKRDLRAALLAYGVIVDEAALSAAQAALFDGPWLDSQADIETDTSLSTDPESPGYVPVGGTIRTRDEGFPYERAEDDATDALYETGGEMRLYAKPNPDRFYASQVGFAGVDDRAQAEKAVAYLRYVKHFVIDKPCYMPGVSDIFEFTSLNGDGITIEFTNDGELIFDTDGSTPHNYVKFEGCTGVDLIRPKIRGLIMPTVRTAKPAIWVKSCENVHVHEHHIDQVHGGGWLVENSENCTAHNGFVANTLADGHHITNGSIGTSKNCWSYGCTSKDTGDDGFACVSYAGNGQATCDTIGHLDFYTEGSGARGSSVIGGDNVRMRGISRDANSSGIMVAQESAYTTHEPRNVDIDVVTHNCGSSANGAIRIGGLAKNVTGRAVSHDAPYAGLQIGDFKDLAAGDSKPCDGVTLSYEGYNSGAAGVSCGGWRNLELDIVSVNSGQSGAEFFFGRGLTLNPKRIEGYSRAVAGKWGLRISASTVFDVKSGIVKDDDTGTFQSLKAVDVLTSTEGRLAKMLIGGGSAADLQMSIQSSCVDVVTDHPRLLTYAGTVVTLTGAFFGQNTQNQFTSASAKTLTVPLNSLQAMPLNQPAKLFNRGANDLTISGAVTFAGGSTTVASGATVILTQIAVDVFKVE